MPNVRNTPKRKRTDCPVCGKNVSYTIPYNSNLSIQMENERFGHAILIRHKFNGEWCETSGASRYYSHLVRTYG